MVKLGSCSTDFREIYKEEWVKTVEKIQVWLKSDKNNRHFSWLLTSYLRQQCHNSTVSQHNSVTTQVSQHNSVKIQQCHNTTVSQHNSVTTQQCHNTTVSQHNSVTTQQCHNSKSLIFRKKSLQFLKCYNFLRVKRRHNCSPAVSFANCVMTLYLLKLHLQTFLSIPITQKCQILSYDTLVVNERFTNLRQLWVLTCHCYRP